MAAPTAPTTPAKNVAFLQQYAANPAAATGKAEATRALTPEEQVQAAQAAQSQGAAHQGPAGGGSKPGRREGLDIPQPPTPPGQEVPIRNIETASARIPGVFVNLPTPASLVVPLLVIVLFWVLIIKVNGKSRWQWLWEVLTGNAVVAPGSSTTPGGALQAATNANLTPDQKNILANISSSVEPTVTELDQSTWQPINPAFVPSFQIAATQGT